MGAVFINQEAGTDFKGNDEIAGDRAVDFFFDDLIPSLRKIYLITKLRRQDLIGGLADGQFGNRDGYTGLFELAAYVNDQVPSITMDAFNFEQIPQVHMVGTDFPIGVVKPVDS